MRTEREREREREREQTQQIVNDSDGKKKAPML